jgi:signal transduction histidine kinase
LLSNWPVANRLIAVAAVASISGLVFGGLRIVDSIETEQAFGRTAQLAILGEQITTLTQNLETERNQFALVDAYAVLQSDAQTNANTNAKSTTNVPVPASISGPLNADLSQQKAILTTDENVTNAQVAKTLPLLDAIGSAFPAGVQAAAASAEAAINGLPGTRTFEQGGNFTETIGVTQDTNPNATGNALAATKPASSFASLVVTPTQVISAYSGGAVLGPLLDFDQDITASSGDATLAEDVRALDAISQAKADASQEQAVVGSLLVEATVPDGTTAPNNTVSATQLTSDTGGIGALASAKGELSDEEQNIFPSAATAEQSAFFTAHAGGQAPGSESVSKAAEIIADLEAVNDPHQLFESVGGTLSEGFSQTTLVGDWNNDLNIETGQLRAVEMQIEGEAVTRAQSLQHQAAEEALETAVATIIAVLLVLGAAVLVGRTLVNPLRKLQADALDIATKRLPERVAAAAASTDSAEASTAVEPIGIVSTDEIGAVARAFDQVHAEAVRLAGTEAQLRGSLNAMFISLSRRSVPLIDRLARMIDSLEQSEDDPEQLANLFAMDHMVTRMRRNSENLLVLAGEEPVRKFTEAVPLADISRAAAAEIEQYNRVSLSVQPGIVIPGQAAADVVHLLAELIENATLFSPQESQVRVSVMELDSGGVLIEVRDEGVGISESRLADMNWRLDHPPVVDVSISRHMGLYAVARLAGRHGIKVRLRPGTPRGLSALVWLPGDLAKKGEITSSQSAARPVGGGGFGGGGITAGERSAPVAERSNGQRRNGSLTSTGSQPTLPPPSAPPSRRPAQTGRPGTVWFTAKRPSNGEVKSADELAASWQSTSTGARPANSSPADAAPPFAAFARPAARAAASAPSEAPATTAGLPRRTPQARPRPGSDAPDNGVAAAAPSASNGNGRSAPLLGASAGGSNGMFNGGTRDQDGLSKRRTADEARSRLSGFQLGNRDASQAPRTTGRSQQVGEENDR